MHRSLLRGVLALASAVAFATPVVAQQSAPDAALSPGSTATTAQAWLEQMSQALVDRPYRGTVAYVRDGRLDALRVEHVPGIGGVGEQRLSSLSGEALEVRAQPGGLSLIDAAGAARLSTGQALAGLRRVRPADAHYEVASLGEDRIAQKPVKVIDLRARDGYRYSHRLWLEKSAGLPLKSVTSGSDGRIVEQWMFTQIEIDPASTSAAQPDVVAPSPSPSAWTVLDAPEGFSLILVDAAPATHLLYSDGVAYVSVYVEPVSQDQATVSGTFGRGGLQGYGRVAHGRQIVAVGDVPSATAERFAHGVMPVAQ